MLFGREEGPSSFRHEQEGMSLGTSASITTLETGIRARFEGFCSLSPPGQLTTNDTAKLEAQEGGHTTNVRVVCFYVPL